MPVSRVSARASPSAAQAVSRSVAGGDDLGQQRVVVGGHLDAGLDPGVDADAVRDLERGDRAGARQVVAVGVLGVDARLDGGAPRVQRRVDDGRVALRQPDHPRDQVDAEHRLGDRVLDLQARVDLEERGLLAHGVVDELDRARGPVVDRLGERAGRRRDQRADLVGKPGRRRLLHHLLVPALQRAVAVAERDDAAEPVAEHLHLDVPRGRDRAAPGRRPRSRTRRPRSGARPPRRRPARRASRTRACRCRRRPPSP